MLKCIILFLCMITCWASQAQQVAMRITNGSFEEFQANNGFFENAIQLYYPLFNDTLYHWFGRGSVLIIQDGECLNNGFNADSPDTSVKPVDGKYFLLLNAQTNSPYTINSVYPNYAIGGIGQKPLCSFKKDIKYSVSLFAAFDSIRFFEQIVDGNCTATLSTQKEPKLSVWLGDASVGFNFQNWFNNPGNNYQEILSEYSVPLRQWEKIALTFIPDRDYDFIYFHPILSALTQQSVGTQNLIYWYLLIDNVSDIYYAEPTFLLPPDDTLTIGDCYQVEPYNIHPNPAEHKWEILGSNNVFHVGADPLLCPTQTTTYLVRSHDECGWAEADTFTLFVKEKPTIPIAPASELVLYPNPGSLDGQIQIRSSHSGTFRLFDASGRLIGNYALVAGEQVLNVSLASGIYFYQALLSDQSRKHGKYLMGRK